MLIEFTVGNYRSFKDKKTLRLDAATSVSEFRENLVEAGKYKLLRSVGVYGANASGKSNLLRAMGVMRSDVLHSASRSSSVGIQFEPFLLNETSSLMPSHFEVVFKVKDTRYRYGFEFDKLRFRAEWLFDSRKDTEKPLFIRDNDEIQVSKNFSEGKGLEKRTKPNTLFLSVCDQFNGSKAKELMAWFEGWASISIETQSDVDRLWGRLYYSVEDAALAAGQIQFVKKLDLGIKDIFLHSEEVPTPLVEEGPAAAPAFMMTPKTVHQKFNDNGEPDGQVEFDMDKAESSGTNKLFDLSGALFNCLNKGGLFIADELDAKLHPLMTRSIVRLFNDPTTNPNNAQLIFATHDTNLLNYGNFRRDQIYFTEKDQYGATDLYSLAEFKSEGNGKVRKDRSFQKDYMQGRYGAVPHLGNLDNLLNPTWQKSEAEPTQ